MSLMNVSAELDEQDDELEFLVWRAWNSDGEHDEQFGWAWTSDDEHESFLMVEHESFLLMLRTIDFLSLDSPNYLSCRNIRIWTKIHSLSPVNSSLFSEILKVDAQQFNSPMSRKEEQSCRQFSPMSKRWAKIWALSNESIGWVLLSANLKKWYWKNARVGKSQIWAKDWVRAVLFLWEFIRWMLLSAFTIMSRIGEPRSR